jgi:hypothetical protein
MKKALNNLDLLESITNDASKAGLASRLCGPTGRSNVQSFRFVDLCFIQFLSLNEAETSKSTGDSYQEEPASVVSRCSSGIINTTLK